MPRNKVIILTTLAKGNVQDLSELVLSLAPPDLDVALVDNSLPDDDKIPLCEGAEAILLNPADLSVRLLRNCPNVKFIQTLSSGYDRLDVKAIHEMGIAIATDGGRNAIAVAEQAIALMITICTKMMLQWQTAMKDRRWQSGIVGGDMVEITNKTVGIVGLGHIGKPVAKRLKGFDTRTIYYDIVEIPLEVQQELNAQPVPFEELLTQSDIVSLHVPLTSSNREMIGERELELMKSTAYLINTSRGRLVDEKALYQALKNKRIAGAALDVLEEEPPSPDNPLFDLDNVVITPHMAAFSHETYVRYANFAYANIKRALAGEPPESLIIP